jgi:LuxR family maltose regulon positive regulatory protein
MTPALLTTKTYIPRPRPNLVARARLFQRLDEGIHAGHRLTLVSAPAGFGKTTLVSAWLSASARPVAWLSLDHEDSDPVRFVQYLIAALRLVDGRFGETTQSLLRLPQVPPVRSLITPLINDLTATGTALTLVLDDYHLVESLEVHEALRFLLEHQPSTLHTVIVTREDPPLPTARLRVQGQITEICERDLRFTPEEAAVFLQQTMGLHLTADAVAALEARTEGWIAGLQLAALALQEDSAYQDNTAAETFIAAFTGSDRYVMDYLMTEVLDRQPEAVRDFLRQTAILDRLTASLCDAITGGADGAAILEYLDDNNLFLIPLDNRREWYRYHHLFADFLRSTLDPDEQRALHRRAGEWFEQHDFPDQAIRHALAAGDLDTAQTLIRRSAEPTFHGGGMQTVRGWLAALPEARLRADGVLAIFQALAYILTGDIAQAEDFAQAAEMAFQQAGEPVPGALWIVYAYIAMSRQDYAQVIDRANMALDALPDDQAHWRILAYWALAEIQERTRPITEAIATLRSIQPIGHALGSQIFAPTIDYFLATDLDYHGQRRAAVTVCEQAIDRYLNGTDSIKPMVGILYSRLSTLLCEADELEAAQHAAERGLDFCQQIGLEYLLVFAYGVQVPILRAQGNIDAALEWLSQARQHASFTSMGDVSWIAAWETTLRLRQGDLAHARRWASDEGITLDEPLTNLRLDTHLAYARLLVAEARQDGARLPDARHWLARLEQFTRDYALYRGLISVYVLQALVAEMAGDRPTAHDALAQAVALAAPGDYYRAFLDEDDQVLPLLPAVRHAAPAFVDHLLVLARAAAPYLGLSDQPLAEPLSERELEVLALIAAGLSNSAIADQLVITVGTVKRHINHIYAKLDVGSRTQAVYRWRELGFLE